MERKITIQILNRKFSLIAKSTEDEADIRNAANKIGEKYNTYLKSFPDKDTSDILSFIALNSIIETERVKKAVKMRDREEQRLHRELESYLNNNVDKI